MLVIILYTMNRPCEVRSTTDVGVLKARSVEFNQRSRVMLKCKAAQPHHDQFF
jgi:hypothetical protein